MKSTEFKQALKSYKFEIFNIETRKFRLTNKAEIFQKTLKAPTYVSARNKALDMLDLSTDELLVGTTLN